MNTKKYTWNYVGGGVLILGIVALILRTEHITTTKPLERQETVYYTCSQGKTIAASYAHGEVIPNADKNKPPTLTGNVILTLSDSRVITLPQTISADGMRYATPDEATIFWGKGNGLMFIENGKQSYLNCVEVAPSKEGLTHVFGDSTNGFSVRYPEGYTVDPSYAYQGFGNNTALHGVKFTIPEALAAGTNLGSDSYISIEKIKDVKSCVATRFLDENVQAVSYTDSGVTYSIASSTGAGAGNRYEETVYALSDTNPCIAVRYFVHYSAFENYPPGAIHEFNKQALLAQFDAIRHTVVVFHQ